MPNRIHHWAKLSTLALTFFLPAILFADETQSAGSGNYLVHTWRTDDGLPQNWVSSIVQTPDGYLWIGTRYGGLARFDGVRFVAFDQQNTPALKDVQVEHLSVDSAGRLWIIMGNTSVTAYENGRFHLYHWPRSEPFFRADSIVHSQSNHILFNAEASYLISLDVDGDTNGWKVIDPLPQKTVPRADTYLQDKNGIVWFVTVANHLGKFENNHFERRALFPGQEGLVVADIALDAQKNLWVATRQHIARWDGTHLEDCTPTNGPPPSNICSIAFSGDGGLWVLEKNRLRKWMDGQWVAEASPWNLDVRFPINPFQMRLYGDAQGNAWVISYGHGLWHVSSDGSAHHLTEKDGLPSLFITCWFQDREGDIWIGTAGGGIARIRMSLFHVYNEAQGLPGKVVRSVCVDTNGTLWAGTLAGGLAYLQNGRFHKFPLPATDSSPVESITVTPNQNGGLWIGSLNHGLVQLKSGDISPIDTSSAMGNSIRVLYTDRHNHLWVGGLVDLYELINGKLIRHGDADGFVNNHAIGAMAEDGKGTLWIGTGPGNLWKYTSNQFTRYYPPKEWPSVRFASVLPDTNGVVWVGTLGGGLLRFYDGKFTRYTTENGLPDNNISQLLDSHDGHIWAGTYAGIFRTSKKDLNAVADGQESRVSCRVYGRFEGLPALECSSGFQPACWQAKDGKLWFTTANGVVSIDPADVTPNRLPPIVIIEQLFVDGNPINLTPKEESTRPVDKRKRPLQIEPGRHYLQFRFTGLNFAAPDGVRFRVKLEGADSQWRDMGSQRLVGYGPLPPGHYQLDVLACNNEGVWNKKGATLAFAVLPFFWETWWFKISVTAGGFIFLGIVVALAQRRRYRLKLERVERQREMERERTRIARDLHDDLGTSLTQISMLSALANREQTQPTEAKSIIEQVRGCARDMVTALDEIVWAVNPKNDSLVELVNYLGHFAEQFFRPTNIRCRLEFPHQFPNHSISADVRHHLFLAYKEALNNTVRHSQAAQVLVRIEIKANEMTICIKDNGQGFDRQTPSSSRKGNGLNNMERRIEEIGGRTDVHSVPTEGTTVNFCLPLK